MNSVELSVAGAEMGILDGFRQSLDQSTAIRPVDLLDMMEHAIEEKKATEQKVVTAESTGRRR